MHKSVTKEKYAVENTTKLWQNRNAFAKSAIAFALILIVAFPGCTGNANENSNNVDACAGSVSCSVPSNEQTETLKGAGSIEKIEVFHFHGTNQCYSCITVGDYAEETLKTFFASELESGKIVFGHINFDLPENQELVEKYEATGSSLWIGTYAVGGKFYKELNSNVWYKTGNKKGYMDYLKGVIEKKLSGELS